MKQTSADGSVASAHVRVGHRQAPDTKPQYPKVLGFFISSEKMMTYESVSPGARRAGEAQLCQGANDRGVSPRAGSSLQRNALPAPINSNIPCDKLANSIPEMGIKAQRRRARRAERASASNVAHLLRQPNLKNPSTKTSSIVQPNRTRSIAFDVKRRN